MADQKTMLEQMGLTRGKVALIGLLAVALGGVLHRQYAGSDAAGTPASLAKTSPWTPPGRPPGAAATPPAVTGESAGASMDAALVEFDQTKWQTPELATVTAYDPFALPAAFPKPARAVLDPALAAEGGDSSAALAAQQLADAVERMQIQLEELKQRGVHVIVNRNDEFVAVIGDRTIRVGDEINGFIVTAIEPDGVRVEGKAVQ